MDSQVDPSRKLGSTWDSVRSGLKTSTESEVFTSPYRRLKKSRGYFSQGGLEDKLFELGDAVPVSIVVKEKRGVALSPRHFRRVESIEFNSSSQDVNPLLAEHISQTDCPVFSESSDVLICDSAWGQTVH